MESIKEKVLAELKAIPGKIGFYYKDLVTGESWGLNENGPLMAASVIKIPILVEAFTRMEAGDLDPNETVVVRQEDKLPSCGALNYLHTGLEVTLEDLYTLMIILSDNSATNMLLKRFGMDAVNSRMRALGLKETTVNRLLFDSEAAAKGLENYISPSEIAALLERMYTGTLVSPKASEKMLEILKNQRLNGKMPFYLHGLGVKIAHKTGEDDGITHDVGIVYAKHPFIACFCSNEVDVPRFETAIQQISKELYDAVEAAQ